MTQSYLPRQFSYSAVKFFICLYLVLLGKYSSSFASISVASFFSFLSKARPWTEIEAWMEPTEMGKGIDWSKREGNGEPFEAFPFYFLL